MAPLRNPDGGVVVLVHELVECLHAALLELIVAIERVFDYVVNFVFKLHQFVHHEHWFLGQFLVFYQQSASFHDLRFEVFRDTAHRD